MKKNELVSIITPMYNGAAFIGETIRSVQAQSYSCWEMIIVDDCSPDNGAGIAEVKKYQSADTRIKLIASPINKGSSGARNIALRNAAGRYIAFLDSDDIWHADFLMSQLSFMRQRNVPLVFSSYRRIDEITKKDLLKPYIVPDKVNYKSLLKSCPIFPSAAIYDTQMTPKIFFNENLGSMRDDYVYWLTMLKSVTYGFGNKEILVDYRMRKTSITGNKMKVIRPQWEVLYKVEKIGLLRSVFNMVCWCYISFVKYYLARK